MNKPDIVDPGDYTPDYWRGHDAAVAGVSERWEQALTAAIPAPGVLGDPKLEDLYRRTEALREAVEKAEKLLGHYNTLMCKGGGAYDPDCADDKVQEARKMLDAALRQQGSNV